MAKPDLFRILGCVVMVTLILVIAVKLSKQCMKRAPPTQSATPRANSATPAAKQAHGVCQSGYRPDQNGFCVEDY